MNKKMFIIVACILVFSLLIGGSMALARDGSARIDIMYRNIQLIVNGQQVPVSADNEPFIYGGRTYVPLRVVSEALGYNVSWDADTSSVIIGDSAVAAPAPTPAPEPTPAPATGEQKLIDVLPPYHVNYRASVRYYPTTQADSLSLGGIDYKNSISLQTGGSASISAYFNLGGNYSTLTGIIGSLSGQVRDVIVNIHADETIIKTFELKAGALPQDFSLDVTGVRELHIELKGPGGAGLAELIIK